MGVEDPFNPAVRPLTAAAAAGDPSVAPPLLQTLADFASAELWIHTSYCILYHRVS
jgi:hypothetical protein